jgi:hypothetical protein
MNDSLFKLLRRAALPLLVAIGATACINWEEPCGPNVCNDQPSPCTDAGGCPPVPECYSDSDCHLLRAPHCDSSGMCIGPAKVVSDDSDAGADAASDATDSDASNDDASSDEASVLDPDGGEAGM